MFDDRFRPKPGESRERPVIQRTGLRIESGQIWQSAVSPLGARRSVQIVRVTPSTIITRVFSRRRNEPTERELRIPRHEFINSRDGYFLVRDVR